jgi:hypothetical protein
MPFLIPPTPMPVSQIFSDHCIITSLTGFSKVEWVPFAQWSSVCFFAHCFRGSHHVVAPLICEPGGTGRVLVADAYLKKHFPNIP